MSAPGAPPTAPPAAAGLGADSAARDPSHGSSRSRRRRRKTHGGRRRTGDRDRDRDRGDRGGVGQDAPVVHHGGGAAPVAAGGPAAPHPPAAAAAATSSMYGYSAHHYGYPPAAYGYPGAHGMGHHLMGYHAAAGAHHQVVPAAHHYPQSGNGVPDDGVSEKVSEKFLMRNDYSQTFVDCGQRPQNFIRDLDYATRYSEYPKIERLIKLKDEILAKRATPGMSLKCDLKEFDLSSLGTKFDVILIDPPWEEYQTRVCGMYVPLEDLSTWTMEELRQLKVGEIADSQSFCFIWCGEMHLEHGRELLKRWGFRRVEDICWVKTNRLAKLDKTGKVERPTLMYGDTSILQRSKEHCLMGVKGTLKRSIDTHFIHANCDVDLIMEEEKEFGSTQKPTELYETIEHFCLGRRRLELFGLDRNLRDGWLTVGNGLTTSNWNKASYLSWFEGDGRWPDTKDHRGGRLLGSIAEIEALRPKSPVRPGRGGPGRSRSRSPRRLGGGPGPPRRGDRDRGGDFRDRGDRRDRRGDRGRDRGGGADDDDKPLPEDMGELAPPIPKDDEDTRLPTMP